MRKIIVIAIANEQTGLEPFEATSTFDDKDLATALKHSKGNEKMAKLHLAMTVLKNNAGSMPDDLRREWSQTFVGTSSGIPTSGNIRVMVSEGDESPKWITGVTRFGNPFEEPG